MTTPPAEWLEVATEEPCRYYLGDRHCEQMPTRLFIYGRRCWTHAPVAITTSKEGGPRG